MSAKGPVDYAAPIPAQPASAGWKSIEFQYVHDPLVPLGSFSAYPGVFHNSIYFAQDRASPYRRGEVEGALLTPFVREGVAERLGYASALLPWGYALLVWDSYRPLGVQQALYDDYKGQLVSKKGMDEKTASEAAQQFVSIPSADPAHPSPHSTGASVDLTLVRFESLPLRAMKKLGREFYRAAAGGDSAAMISLEERRMAIAHAHAIFPDMGTAFDEVSPKTLTRYFEDHAGTPARDNRRMLFNVMTAAGFTNYEEEWWHFDRGNQMDAKRMGGRAIYGAATLSEENKNWEDARRKELVNEPWRLHPKAKRLEAL